MKAALIKRFLVDRKVTSQTLYQNDFSKVEIDNTNHAPEGKPLY